MGTITEMKIKIGWTEFGKMVETLTERLKTLDPKPAIIYGIPRGGVCLAVALSYRLGIPYTSALKDIWKYRKKEGSVLIVDDIADSGATLQKIKNYLSIDSPILIYHPMATLVYYQASTVRPDYHIVEKREGEWFIFPWETEETSKVDGFLVIP